MGKRIAVIDTENASASLYADRFKFDLMEIEPPYTIDKYLKGIEAAIQAKYDVLIVDSLTHAWAAEGGLLDKKQGLDSRGGNGYTNWATITKEHEMFRSKILQSDITMICTMRSKQEYVLEQNEKGKSVPKKVGMAPIQRDGLEYEFTVVFDLGQDHQAMVSKDRTSLFDGKIWTPSEETGKQLLEWQSSGSLVPTKVSKEPEPAAPIAQPTTTVPVTDTGWGGYIPKKGTYAGRQLKDVPVPELRLYLKNIEDKLAGKAPQGDLAEVVVAVRGHLKDNQGVQF